MCPADWHGLAWLLRSHLILTLKCVHSRGKDSLVSTTEMSATGKKLFPWGSSAMVAMVAKIKCFDKRCSLLLQSDRLFGMYKFFSKKAMGKYSDTTSHGTILISYLQFHHSTELKFAASTCSLVTKSAQLWHSYEKALSELAYMYVDHSNINSRVRYFCIQQC